MSNVETYEEMDAMLTGISTRNDTAKLWVGYYLLEIIKMSSFGLATSPVGCESNGSILLCISSCKLGKSWCGQPQSNGIPSNRRLAIVSARSDVCCASKSTWSDMFIESTSTPMAISYGMALAPVMISVLLHRCSRTSGCKLSHNSICKQ